MDNTDGWRERCRASESRILCVSTWLGVHDLFYARGWCLGTCGGVCNNAAKRLGSRRVVTCSLRADLEAVSKDRLIFNSHMCNLCHPVGQDNGQLCPWCYGWALSSSSVEKSNKALSSWLWSPVHPSVGAHRHQLLSLTVPSDSSTVLCFNASLLLCHSCC